MKFSWLLLLAALALVGLWSSTSESQGEGHLPEEGSEARAETLIELNQRQAPEVAPTLPRLKLVRAGMIEGRLRIEREVFSRSSIMLKASSRLLHTILPEPERVTLTGEDGVPRPSRSSSFMFFVYDDLEPGKYTLAIDDPRFLPWSCVVRPGVVVEAELEGTSAIALRVRDGTGMAIEFFAVNLELRNVNFSPNEIVVPDWSILWSGRVVTGLTPGDYRVTVYKGEQIGSVDVAGLALGETRAIDVLVGDPCVVSGYVRYSDGEPGVGIDVALFPAASDLQPSEAFEGMTLARRALFDKDAEKVATDERGAFHFAVARPGEYLVCAWASNGSEVGTEVLVPGPGQRQEGLELVLPRGGVVAGRILAPEGASCAGLRVWIFPDESGSIRGLRVFDETACEVDPDGHFEIGPIPPGPSRVRLLLPKMRLQRGSSSVGGFGGSNGIELGALEVVGGGRVERDFAVSEFPGTVSLRVLVNGEAAAGLGVELSMTAGEKRFRVLGQTDIRGRFGPALAFPGFWTVQVNDPDAGWPYRHSAPVLVTAASESREEIQVQLTEASLLFLDAESGVPLANRTISLLGPPGDDRAADSPWLRREADAEGRATWIIPAGEYRFRLDLGADEFPFPPDWVESGEEQRIAPAVWTPIGPLTHEIRL